MDDNYAELVMKKYCEEIISQRDKIWALDKECQDLRISVAGQAGKLVSVIDEIGRSGYSPRKFKSVKEVQIELMNMIKLKEI